MIGGTNMHGEPASKCATHFEPGRQLYCSLLAGDDLELVVVQGW